jgi:hypothetical protein
MDDSWLADAADATASPPSTWSSWLADAADDAYSWSPAAALAFAVCVVVTAAARAIWQTNPQSPSHDPETVQHFSKVLGIPVAEAARMLSDLESSTPTEVVPRLLLGNKACAQDQAALGRAGVTHVLNASSDLPNYFEGALMYRRVSVEDSLDAQLGSQLDGAVDWIAAVLENTSGSVLVHCRQGASRSPVSQRRWQRWHCTLEAHDAAIPGSPALFEPCERRRSCSHS